MAAEGAEVCAATVPFVAAEELSLYDGIITTRAIRRFTDEPVSDDDVLTILRAAQQGPSGGNIQPWQFLVVTDADLRARLGDVYRRAYTRYEAAMLPGVGPFRTEDDEASWNRTIASSRHGSPFAPASQANRRAPAIHSSVSAR